MIICAFIAGFSACDDNNGCFFQSSLAFNENDFHNRSTLPESLCGMKRTDIPMYFASEEVIQESAFSHSRKLRVGLSSYRLQGKFEDFEYLYRVDGEVVSFDRNPTIQIQKEYLDTVTIELFIHRNGLFDYSWKQYRDSEIIDAGE